MATHFCLIVKATVAAYMVELLASVVMVCKFPLFLFLGKYFQFV